MKVGVLWSICDSVSAVNRYCRTSTDCELCIVVHTVLCVAERLYFSLLDVLHTGAGDEAVAVNLSLIHI